MNAYVRPGNPPRKRAIALDWLSFILPSNCVELWSTSRICRAGEADGGRSDYNFG